MAGLSDQDKKARIAALLKKKQQQQGYPLSFEQSRLWFLHQLNPLSQAYHIVSAFRVEAAFDLERLERSLNGLAHRHPQLNFRVKQSGSMSTQILSPLPVPFTVEDIKECESSDWLKRAVQAPIHLMTGPAWRVDVAQVQDAQHIVIKIHHLAADGWSMQLIQNELQTIYQNFAEGVNSTLPEIKFQYTDYILWQQQQAIEKDTISLKYWTEQLSNIQPLELPYDFVRPAKPTMQGAVVKQVLEASTLSKLDGLKQSVPGCTEFMLFVMALQLLFYRYSKQSEFVIATPVAGRNEVQLRQIVGYFVDTVLLKATVTSTDTVKNRLVDTCEQVLSAFEHSHIPFQKLVDKLLPERDLSSSPIFEVMFAWQNIDFSESENQVEELTQHNNTAKFDLTVISIPQKEGGVELIWEYSTDVFTEETVQEMGFVLNRVLNLMASDSATTVNELPFLSPEEIDRMASPVHTFDLPDYTILDYLEKWASLKPNDQSIQFQTEQYRYGDLNERVQRYAAALTSYGVIKGQCVAVALDKSIDLVPVLLAVMYVGGIYVPIDSAIPEFRQIDMLDDCGANVFVTAQNTQYSVAHQCTLDDLVQPHKAEVSTSLACADDVAYMIYTSGSTGKPKGVPITHHAMMNMLQAFDGLVEPHHSQHFSLWGSVSFDISVFEMFSSLKAGGVLHIMPEDVRQETAAYTDWLIDHNIHSAYLPGFALQPLLSVAKEKPNALQLKQVLVGVEPIQAVLLQQLQKCIPGLQIVHGYGPTEATVFTTLHKVLTHAEYHDDIIPLGQAIINTALILLDDDLKLVPKGVVGQLYVAGVHLSPGYWHDEVKTQHAFKTINGIEGRWYATGDMARVNCKGDLIFVGRKDFQIKRRGYRIELGDVEAACLKLQGVDEACVRLRRNEDAIELLVAYIRTSAQDGESELLIQLKQVLPNYLLPDVIVSVPEFPRTLNGKIDVSALPLPKVTTLEATVVADDSIIAMVQAAWQQVLDVETIGVHDHFFSVGGDSIKSIQVVAILRAQNWDVTIQDLFQFPTITQLSNQLQPIKARIEVGGLSQLNGLSPVQSWFFTLPLEQRSHWNQITLLQLKQPISGSVLSAVCTALVQRHSELCLQFLEKDNVWSQQTQALTHNVAFMHDDVGENASKEAIVTCINHLQADINITSGEVFRADYFKREHEEDVLCLTAHHLVVDRVSWQIIIDDLFKLVQLHEAGSELALPEKSIPFVYWANTHLSLTAMPVKTVAAGLQWQPKSGVNVEQDSHYSAAQLPKGLTQQLAQANESYHTKTQELLTVALVMACLAEEQAQSLALTIEHHGREDATGLDLNSTVGWFTALSTTTFSLPDSTDLGDVIKSLKEQCRQSIPSQQSTLNHVGVPLLAQMSLNYFGSSSTSQAPYDTISDWPIIERGLKNARPFLIDWVASIHQGQLTLVSAFSTQQFETRWIESLLDRVIQNLSTVIE
ncbi:MAG: amino acid adenylation domain-containing protein, partial [Methylococcales bacterium]|nr:amino acid adenylation domain-containing protein [Methylococcales bacterium]